MTAPTIISTYIYSYLCNVMFFKQITSWILLAVLSWSIIPLESFHHHEEHSVVCTESANHFETKKFECQLADFVLPVFTNNNIRVAFRTKTLLNVFLIARISLEKNTKNTNLYSRGPPTFLV